MSAIFNVTASRKLTALQTECRSLLACYGPHFPPAEKAELTRDAGNPEEDVLEVFQVKQKTGETVSRAHDRAYEEGAAKYPGAEITVDRAPK